jgi:hypothetical protein
MDINLSQISPFLWVVAAVLGLIIAIAIIRFFWQHILKYIVQGCLALVGIGILLAVLHYVFKLF